jgi:hypothetical protein
MNYSRALSIVVAVAAVSPSAALAQRSDVSGGRAYAVEAAGGTIGSVAGAVVGLAISRPDRCGVDDLACTIQGLGAAGIGSVIGATAGTVIAGRRIGSRPSGFGAFAGSVAGAVAGVALVHAMTEEANLKLEQPATVIVYSVTQGLLAAIGSRLVASLRN